LFKALDIACEFSALLTARDLALVFRLIAALRFAPRAAIEG
jgi:hypothetical protein